MKIQLIKLIQNELIKIFKKKSIYILFIIALVSILFHNYADLDQKQIELFSPINYKIESIEKRLNKMNIGSREYVQCKIELDFAKLYNNYEEDSWQSLALEEETVKHSYSNVTTTFYHTIMQCLNTINNYEFNKTSNIKKNEYQIAKDYYEKYVQALDSNDWKSFLNLKIQELKAKKELIDSSSIENRIIDLDIEIYQLRIDNNIEFKKDILNDYLETYRENSYSIEYYKDIKENTPMQKQNLERQEEIVNLCKYAIENHIVQDISPEDYNIMLNNKIDARISLIRVFKHFSVIIEIIAIYIACSTLIEEKSKGTIKSLLTKPHKRRSVLFSKIIGCIITTIIVIIGIILLQYIIGGLTFGFDSYQLDYIGYNTQTKEVFTINLLNYILLMAITKIPIYLILILLGIFMSIINENIPITFILSMVIYILLSYIIPNILEAMSTITDVNWISKFLIISNWDFSQYLFGSIPAIEGLSFNFSVIIYIFYFIVMLGISTFIFSKKDIYNI